MDLDESRTIPRFDQRVFAAAPEGRKERNLIWPNAHRFEDWSALSELSLWIMTCGNAGVDAEYIISMQLNIAGLHPTRFGRPSIEARLREWANHTTPVQLTRGAMGETNKLDDSDYP
jgi:hypothetical protein